MHLYVSGRMNNYTAERSRIVTIIASSILAPARCKATIIDKLCKDGPYRLQIWLYIRTSRSQSYCMASRVPLWIYDQNYFGKIKYYQEIPEPNRTTVDHRFHLYTFISLWLQFMINSHFPP